MVLRRELNREPTESELAEKLEWTVERTRYVAQVVADARRRYDEEMLQFIDPVLRASHQEAAPQSVANLVNTVVSEQQRQASATRPADPELQAQQALFNHHVNAVTLGTWSNIATANTINLMHAINGNR